MRYGALAAVALFLAAPVVGIPHEPVPARLDVLYIGAHPDDEAYSLATFGQLNADHKLRVGVVTITRGEGGGSAVGPQEGPALGQIREAEERRAVAKAGIHDVVNLDRPDFYYTVSSPLTEQVWGKDETLAKVVRVIRETQPKTVFTMDPAPTPGNHGNHQFAARLAIEAFRAAADPNAYPDQLSQEGLHPWSASRLFIDGLQGQRPLGGTCVSDFTPTEPTDRVWGVWSGQPAAGGGTWAKVERDAQRQYASQGWVSFPDVPTDPSKLGCEYFTQVAGRVAYNVDTRGADGLLPSDLTLYATPSRYEVTPGSSVDVNVTASPGPLTLSAPPGWTVLSVAASIRARPARWSTSSHRSPPNHRCCRNSPSSARGRGRPVIPSWATACPRCSPCRWAVAAVSTSRSATTARHRRPAASS
jgi:LmbE family N-acetylglucosaminyl deacetylase